MRRAMFALAATTLLAASSGCCCLDRMFGCGWGCCGGGCGGCCDDCYGSSCGGCGSCGCDDCGGGCGGGGGCGCGGGGGEMMGGGPGGCESCGMAENQPMPRPKYAHHAKRHAQPADMYAAGPPAAQVTYPYYSNRGPRDFLAKNPRSIGPY